MSKLIVLFRPKDNVLATAKKAAEKFKLMHGIGYQVVPCKTINEIGFHLSQKNVAIIFVEQYLQQADSNTLVGHYLGQKERPYIVTDNESFLSLRNHLPKDKLGYTETEFSETFIFDCLRNLLAPTGKKIDIRYIQEVVKKLVEVVHQNTEFQLVPKRISETSESARKINIVSVVAFYGDGFLGSLTVTTSPNLMTMFAEKMLFLPEGSTLGQEALLDLLGEVSNQIEGAVRNGLQMFGYRLTSSMQLSLVGQEILYDEKTGGLNYDILFTLGEEELNANLSYNTYRTSIGEIGEKTKRVTRRSLDVRLLNYAIQSTISEASQQLGVNLSKSGLKPQTQGIEKASTILVLHASDWQNKITILIVFKNPLPPADIEKEGTDSDRFNRLLLAVSTSFLLESRSKGYTLQRIYQGQFSAATFDFNLLNTGLFVRQELSSETLSADLLFGMDSSAVDPYYDVWPCFKEEGFLKRLPLAFSTSP